MSRRHFHLSCFALPIALVVRGTLVCLIAATAALAAGVDSLPMLPGPVLLNVNVSPEELEREPLAGPIVTAPAQLRGNRATVWTQDGVRWVAMERDVQVIVGSFAFRAQRAIVRIAPQQGPGGQRVHHLAIYLDQATQVRGRGSMGAEAPRLLVTVTTSGFVELETDLLRQDPQSVAAMQGDPLTVDARGRFDRYFASLHRKTLDVPDVGPTGEIDLMSEEETARRDARRREIQAERAAALERRRQGHEEQAAAPQLQPTTTTPEPATPEAPAETAVETPVAPVPPTAEREAPAEQPEPTTPALPAPQPSATAELPAPPAADTSETIMPRQGVINFMADRIVIQGGEGALADTDDVEAPRAESYLLLMGNVTVMYTSATSDRVLTLTADNAVIFLRGGSIADLASRQAGAEGVMGVYLEDNVVATDGQYTLRAPRMYYDRELDRAVILEAVLYTWDFSRQIPIYVRAERVRQESRTSWSADNALITTSEFAQPHVAIGASTLTFTQTERSDGTRSNRFTARDATVRAAGVPVFYWPYLAGEPQQTPLRDLRIDHSSDTGLTVRTRWDLFALAGRSAPDGVDLLGEVSYLGEHGVGLGVELDYNLPETFGYLSAFILPNDTGDDDIGDRDEIEQDGEVRGHVLLRHRQYLRDNWELTLEASYVSDPMYLEEFFPSWAAEDKPWETLIYLKKQEADWALTALASYDLNDFVAQTTVLQSPGYIVEKLPEIGYYRVATSLWENRLTYYTETRVSRMRIRPGDDEPDERGFTDAQSMLLFGISSSVPFEDRFDDIPSNYVGRFDTRHEVQAPMKFGPLDVVPYAAGRITVYDDDFDDYPGGDENSRLMGTLGLRLHTQFHGIADNVDIPILDVRRIRHIVEPSIDLYTTASTADPEDFPVFDPEVEMITEGSGMRLGLRNTFQTMRGAPGRERSVDWLVVDTSLVLRSRDADVDTTLPRFFAYRPEYSLGGDHFHTELMWMVTDALGITAEIVNNLEDDFTPTWRIGAAFDHTPRLRSFVNYVDLQAVDARLLSWGFTYLLTPKYIVGFEHTANLEDEDDGTRELVVTLERRMPRWRFRVFVSHDDIDDEQVVGFTLFPEGFGGESPLNEPLRYWYR